MRVIIDSDSEIVPGAARYRDAALAIMMDKVRSSGLPIEMRTVVRSDGYHLETSVRFGDGLLRGSRHALEARADPCGTALHVGWFLSREDGAVARAMLGAPAGWRQRLMDRVDAGSRLERERVSLSRAFHDLVFLPTVDVLVAGIEGRPVCRRPR